MSGIGPINLLEYSDKIASDAILPNEVGIDPLSELSFNTKLTSDVNALKLFGRVPVREQKWIMMFVNVVILLIEDGIEPVNELGPI